MNAPIPTPNQVPANPPSAPQGKAFTNQTVPAPAKEDRVIPYEEITAKPLTTPNFLDIQPKNKNMSVRWGNRSVGDKESKMRIHDLIARGFRPAKPDEVTLKDGSAIPESLVVNSQLVYGDLMLLIIPRTMYEGALKYNAQTAQLRVQRRGDNQGEERVLQQAARGKVKFYEPAGAEAEKTIHDNESAPRLK
jgi:hypothetical protein